MANTTDLLDLVWQEVYHPSVMEMTRKLSRLMAEMVWDAGGVTNDPLISRDWEYIQPFVVGLSGAAEFAPIGGPNVANTPQGIGYTALVDAETFPGMGESVNTEYFHIKHRLKMMNINVFIPLHLMRAARMGAVIDDIVERWIRQSAKRVAHLRCVAFFADSAATLGRTVTATSGTISSTGLSVTLAAGFPIKRFGPSGITADIFTTGANIRLNTVPVIISRPDAFGTSGSPISDSTGTILLSHVGAATTVLASAQYDIVIRNSGRENAGDTSRLPTRLDSILVDSGEISDYGVHVSGSPPAGEFGPYPQLKSLIRDAALETPSENLFAPYVAHYSEWNDGQFPIDTLWARPGGWAAYFTNLDGQYRMDRNGLSVKIQGGVQEGVNLNYFGFELTGKSDTFIAPNIWYGLLMNGDDGPNWQIKVPPRIPGTESHPAFDPGVEFVASIWNKNRSIFDVYNEVGGPNAGAITKQVQAPAEMVYEIAPKSIPGLKIINVAENIR